jgi:hypothetical protein
VFCENYIYGQFSNKNENTNKPTIVKDFYVKYEADTNVIITHLPKPKLTPEAIENFVEREIQVQMLLKADGTVDNIVFFGTLRNGMHGRVLASIREIKFKVVN